MKPGLKMYMAATSANRSGRFGRTGTADMEYDRAEDTYARYDNQRGSRGNRANSRGEMDYEKRERPEMNSPYGGYSNNREGNAGYLPRNEGDPEMARRRYSRDSRGRFRPRGEMNMGMDMEEDDDDKVMDAYYPKMPVLPPYYDREEIKPIRKIGFVVEPTEYNREYRGTVEYPNMLEGEYLRGEDPMMGHAMPDETPKFTKDMAEKWMKGLENSDGSRGPHWSMEQAKQVMASKGVPGDPLPFFVALNAMYADYSKVFKRHGVGDKLDLYVDMAKAFLEDEDAQPEKLARYYRYIVKH